MDSSDWMSQEDAAAVLGVSQLRLAFLMAGDHVVIATRKLTREKGVLRSSVGAELQWRTEARVGARARRLAGDVVSFF